MSGNYLALSDPQSIFFGNGTTTGHRYKLDEDIPDAYISPFHDVCSFFKCSCDKVCNATVFRFPLRQVSTKISTTLYDGDKMNALFDSFTYDAHLILLFLKNVKNIGLYKKSKGKNIIEPIFSVRVSSSSLIDGCVKRSHFFNQIQPGCILDEALTCTYRLTVETTNYNSDKKIPVQKSYDYIINEYFAGGKVSVQLQDLTQEKSFGYPLVGIAKELSPQEVCTPGQVFCFLPLPIEQKSVTGLPVHVNGCFAVSQNRRHLKWPTAGQDLKTKGSDKSLIWNKCLLEELIPNAYICLIRDAIIMNRQNNIHYGHIINSFPDMCFVNEKWLVIIQPLYTELFKIPVFYTQSDKGKWIKGEECWFDCCLMESKDKSFEVVTSLLIAANKPIVSCPLFLMTTMGAFSSILPETVSPFLVRHTILEDVDVIQKFNYNEKLLLLDYCVQDLFNNDLEGLPLLPLESGEFIQFDSKQQCVFITNDNFPQTMLLGLDEILLANTLEQGTLRILHKLAKEGTLS